MPSLSNLIRSELEAKGLRAADIHRSLTAQGVKISLQSVCNWANGGGIKPTHIAPLARALGVDPVAVALAAAGIAAA